MFKGLNRGWPKWVGSNMCSEAHHLVLFWRNWRKLIVTIDLQYPRVQISYWCSLFYKLKGRQFSNFLHQEDHIYQLTKY
jgi:hypothetical protein